MPRKKIVMEKTREIIRLHSVVGMSYRSIAEKVGVGKSTVSEIIADFKRTGVPVEEFEKMSDSAYLEILHVEKKKCCETYENLSEFFEYIDREIKRRGVTLKLLYNEYLDADPEGYSYSRFCYHYKMWSKKDKISMHLVHKAGDKMYVDFAGDKLKAHLKNNGEVTEQEVFVAILPCSQMTYVEAATDQKKETFIRCCENALRFFGGTPRAIVPDCLKSAVTKADKREPLLNETFSDFARHYGTTILPARPKKPKDKALVEGAVNLTYQRVYAPLRNQVFHSLSDLNGQIRKHLDVHNKTCFQGRKVSRMDQFKDVESQELRPLPTIRYEMKEVEIRTVQNNYHVYLKGDDRYYSVPFKFRSERVKIVHDSRTVEIYYDNKRIAMHLKNSSNNKYVTAKDHMPSNHRFMVDQSKEKLLQWARNIGPATHIFTRNVFADRDHPEQAYKSLYGILGMGDKYGNEAVEKACKSAIKRNAVTYKFIKNFLENNRHKVPEEVEQKELPFNPTTRGKNYYGGKK